MMLMRPHLSNRYHLLTASFSCLASSKRAGANVTGRLRPSCGVAVLVGTVATLAGALPTPDALGPSLPTLPPLLNPEGIVGGKGRRAETLIEPPVVASPLLTRPPFAVRPLLVTDLGLFPLCSSGLEVERVSGFPAAETSRLEADLTSPGESCLCRLPELGPLPGAPAARLLGCRAAAAPPLPKGTLCDE